MDGTQAEPTSDMANLSSMAQKLKELATWAGSRKYTSLALTFQKTPLPTTKFNMELRIMGASNTICST